MLSTDWIKVSDRLPEAKYISDIEKGYSDVVLVYGFRYTPIGRRHQFSDAAFYDHEFKNWSDKNGEVIVGCVTHWMPIELPEDVEAK